MAEDMPAPDDPKSLVHIQYESGIWDHQVRACLLPFVARRAGAQVVITVHALNAPKAWLPVLLSSAHEITVCSHRQLKSLRMVPGWKKKVRLVPVGSALPYVPPKPRGAGVPLQLVYFGFVWRGRNIEWCIDALSHLIRMGCNATLRVIGGVKERRYQEELQEHARKTNVGNCILFLEGLSAREVAQQLAESDGALLPYASGISTGRTTLMACLQHSLPVLSTYSGNESDGFDFDGGVVLSKNCSSFACCAEVFLSECKRKELGEGGNRLFRERFTWPIIAAQIRDLPSYRKVFG